MSQRTLSTFAGIHCDDTIIVCGCGSSLNRLAHPERFITIGVNDVGRRFDPTYLVVVNPPSQFQADRFRYVEKSKARYLFTQLDLGLATPPTVRFQLGRYGGTTFTDPNVLHYTRNSPYVAVCLAAHMGARRIGLIGVDFTDDHFFGPTGTHPLAAQLAAIDAEYVKLGDALSQLGVEVFNLSQASRLTAFPKRPLEVAAAAAPARRRVFAVTYRFLACGDVITDGLRHAAAEGGVDWAEASWEDAGLRSRVAQFAPDVLLVVHGRRFVQRWGSAFDQHRSAVWLLDEPYEVDDTASFSRHFTHVFVNDRATLARHHNAHYLPVCHDPSRHYPADAPRPYDVGFVGGANPTRERLLAGLAARGLLSYVVGGPWRDATLNRLSRARNVPASETADLYRSTKIVVNVFRDLHHFNRQRIAGTSMNPRIYEALACGALVVSEGRPEIAQVVPELPVFDNDEELTELVEHFLANPDLLRATREACMARIRKATYLDRLRTILQVTESADDPARGAEDRREQVTATRTADGPAEPTGLPLPDDWEICGPVECRLVEGAVSLRGVRPSAPGSERGLVTVRSHRDLALSFEALIAPDACFVAKVNQSAKLDQCTNSYHLYCQDGGAYLARHYCVFRTLQVPRGRWVRLQLSFDRGLLAVCESGHELFSVRDDLLREGFAFLGVKRGEVLLRNFRILPPGARAPEAAPALEGHLVCAGDPALRPRVSIVTTVYDRVACLADCIRSVRTLQFRDYEHIVVSDSPPAAVVDGIAALVRSFADGRISYVNLHERHNDWGIAPAAVGLRRAVGEYVCFLSDDNGYTPDHAGRLVSELDRDPNLGFVYSSCRYGGRLVLRHPEPAPARIDLGQPMFRRDLFRTHLGDDLPFHMMAWDWALIDTLVKRGVRWKHVDVPSFIFRLARYPQLMVQG